MGPTPERAPARAMGQMPILEYLRYRIVASYMAQEHTAHGNRSWAIDREEAQKVNTATSACRRPVSVLRRQEAKARILSAAVTSLGSKAEASMKYRNLEQIAREADVHQALAMSRRDRLERWAELLAQQPERRLRAIGGTEFGTRRERRAKRAGDSPLTVAFEDPVLRAEGLRGDRVGDAVDFFNLSEGDVHHLVCYCHFGQTVSAGAVAARLRMMARRAELPALPASYLVAGR